MVLSSHWKPVRLMSCAHWLLFSTLYCWLLQPSQPSFFPAVWFLQAMEDPGHSHIMCNFWGAKLLFISLVVSTDGLEEKVVPSVLHVKCIWQKMRMCGNRKRFCSGYQSILCVLHTLQLCLFFCCQPDILNGNAWILRMWFIKFVCGWPLEPDPSAEAWIAWEENSDKPQNDQQGWNLHVCVSLTRSNCSADGSQ